MRFLFDFSVYRPSYQDANKANVVSCKVACTTIYIAITLQPSSSPSPLPSLLSHTAFIGPPNCCDHLYPPQPLAPPLLPPTPITIAVTTLNHRCWNHHPHHKRHHAKIYITKNSLLPLRDTLSGSIYDGFDDLIVEFFIP